MRLRAASKDERLLVCYEAGDDGFWLARTLAAEGVDCRVLDPASLQVNRRARRVKTDRIDVLMLVRALIAIDRGDRHVCAIVNVPSIEEEDARRSHRERQRLIRERTAHTTGSRAFSSRKAFAASRRVDANVSISRSCAPAKGIRWQIGFGPNSNANMPGLIS
jgi:transposase